MIHVQEEKSSMVVRWFISGSFEERSKFSAVCNLNHVTDDIIEVEGLCGKDINRTFWYELYDSIRIMGYKEIHVNRNNRWKIINVK